MRTRIGIDVGGTFTDFVLVDEGRIAVEKHPTTTQDPSVGALEGLDLLLERHGVPLEAVEQIVHGTTLVANALIERRGAVTGLLATEGFRDTLEIRREVRFDIYDLGIEFPAPLVPRPLRREVRERTDHYGSILLELDEDSLRTEVEELLQAGASSVAVCLLHSYANATHERRIKELLGAEFPQLLVSISSDITAFIGEYERTSTTVVNAYVQPLIRGYLERLEDGLQRRGFRGDFYLMTSAGGTITVETAARYPVLLLESGPVAGALMSQYLGRGIGVENLLAFDMGGTTAKGCVIKGGALRKEYATEVARSYQYKKGSGIPLMIPSVQLIEIGAGGGSIASVDTLGRLRVGPESAGADPGPACYGRGGAHPTVTDADLLLGYLDPGFFLGGEMRLDLEAGRQAMQREVAEPLSVELIEAARGVHDVANENIARAFRLHTAESGVDIIGHDLVAFGGAGPVHAVRVAKRLGVRRVIVPWGAGVFSAFGLLVTPLGFDVVQTAVQPLDELTAESMKQRFTALEERTMEMLRHARVSPGDVSLTRTMDLRYQGQSYTVEVTANGLDSGDTRADLERRFVAAYTKLYGTAPSGAPMEVLNWKVAGTGPITALDLRLTRDSATEAATSTPPTGGPDGHTALKGHRDVYVFETGGFLRCPIYDRYRLAPEDVVTGPAVVEERESSLLLDPGDVGQVDEHLNIRIVLAQGGA